MTGACFQRQCLGVMVEDAIGKIEKAQQRLKKAQAQALEIMSRQQARLELNRRIIDEASGRAHL